MDRREIEFPLMRAFEISVNGERLCVAGSVHTNVLNAAITYLSKRQEFDMRVGAIVMDDNLSNYAYWVKRSLSVGDVVQLKIVDVPEADEPIERKSASDLGWQPMGPSPEGR